MTEPADMPQGFTLIEVLTAMVITGTVIAVFFQVLSAAMRLELSTVDRTAQIIDARQVFAGLSVLDVRESDFAWEGRRNGFSWSLRLEEVETLDHQWEGESIAVPDSELYRYVFEHQSQDKTTISIIRYIQHHPGHFSDDFKRTHFN